MYEGKDSMFPIIDEVKNTLEERAGMYGSPEDSFERIGKMWTAYTGYEYTAKDVAVMMILMKCAREAFQNKRDNFVDIIGYAAHAGNFADAERDAVQYEEAFKEAVQKEEVNTDRDRTEEEVTDYIQGLLDILEASQVSGNSTSPHMFRVRLKRKDNNDAEDEEAIIDSMVEKMLGDIFGHRHSKTSGPNKNT